MNGIVSRISVDSGTLAGSLGFSLRRHYVDDFHARHVQVFPQGSLVLDLAGNRTSKRGLFDIERYGLNVVYANLSTAKHPDVQADAHWLPFGTGVFDGVICSEMLEHVPDPVHVLSEIRRVLKKNGTVLISVPFLNRIHGDPYDFGRYTDTYWQEVLKSLKFEPINIERQGLFWSVLVDMLREYMNTKAARFRSPGLIFLLGALVRIMKGMALWLDSGNFTQSSSVLKNYTSGFGIEAVKT